MLGMARREFINVDVFMALMFLSWGEMLLASS